MNSSGLRFDSLKLLDILLAAIIHLEVEEGKAILQIERFHKSLEKNLWVLFFANSAGCFPLVVLLKIQN